LDIFIFQLLCQLSANQREYVAITNINSKGFSGQNSTFLILPPRSRKVLIYIQFVFQNTLYLYARCAIHNFTNAKRNLQNSTSPICAKCSLAFSKLIVEKFREISSNFKILMFYIMRASCLCVVPRQEQRWSDFDLETDLIERMILVLKTASTKSNH
jgi:hypothetical protein